ncbi:MAG: peptidyl-prolyl cis-trans isomerase SurA [bacterium F082]|nr:MAG: peptidyl-prolyl cis-trans isomerase SurA [bacterium F082]
MFTTMKRNLIIIALMLLALPMMAQNRQSQVIDKVVAVVGKNIILQSDIENQYIQYRMQGMAEGTGKEVRGRILEDLLLQKLMLNQAEMDSITVTDEQVEAELNRRIQWFIARIGSQEKMEAQFGKSMSEIKDEVRQASKDNMLQEQVQAKIMENVVVTPKEVKEFYRDIPRDSLPMIDSDYELVQIVKRPPVSIDEKLMVKDRLYQIRKRILDGESSFATMAVLYSEDPGSSRQGGELGFAGKGVYATEFENVAFNLRDGEISDVVETEFGFHIIQLIERRGETINCRHILLTAKVPVEALEKAQNELDSVAQLVRNGNMTFEEACKKYSDDDSKNNGGYLTNMGTGGNWLSMKDLQELEQSYPEYKNLAFVINRLEVGEISDPLPMTTNDNKDAFRLIMIKRKTEPHQANLKDDYNLIQNWAMSQKRQEALGKWVSEKAAKAYIRLDDTFKDYDFYYDWKFQ